MSILQGNGLLQFLLGLLGIWAPRSKVVCTCECVVPGDCFSFPLWRRDVKGLEVGLCGREVCDGETMRHFYSIASKLVSAIKAGLLHYFLGILISRLGLKLLYSCLETNTLLCAFVPGNNISKTMRWILWVCLETQWIRRALVEEVWMLLSIW